MSNRTFKPNKQSSKQKLKQLETAVANMQQMFNIQKLVAQQFSNNLGKLDRDVNNSMSVINDLQYRTLAILHVLTEVFPTVTMDAIEEKAEALKLKDYNEASDKEDKERGYVDDDIVGEESIVILTSECKNDPDRSIFRTKFKMSEEVLLGDVQEKLIGLKVGEKVEVDLPDGNTHELEVLSIKKETVKPEDVEAAEKNKQDQPTLQ